jgi:hypothetical protein
LCVMFHFAPTVVTDWETPCEKAALGTVRLSLTLTLT